MRGVPSSPAQRTDTSSRLRPQRVASQVTRPTGLQAGVGLETNFMPQAGKCSKGSPTSARFGGPGWNRPAEHMSDSVPGGTHALPLKALVPGRGGVDGHCGNGTDLPLVGLPPLSQSLSSLHAKSGDGDGLPSFLSSSGGSTAQKGGTVGEKRGRE